MIGILNSETILDYYIQCIEIKFIAKKEKDDAKIEKKIGFLDKDFINQYKKTHHRNCVIFYKSMHIWLYSN